MKFTSLAALASLVASDNQVPVPSELLGWQLGNQNSDVELFLFYDLLCPGSKAMHYTVKEFLAMPSPV